MKESRQRTEFSVKLGLDLATDCLEIGPTDEKRGKKKTTLETWQVPKLQLTTTEHQKGGGGQRVSGRKMEGFFRGMGERAKNGLQMFVG